MTLYSARKFQLSVTFLSLALLSGCREYQFELQRLSSQNIVDLSPSGNGSASGSGSTSGSGSLASKADSQACGIGGGLVNNTAFASAVVAAFASQAPQGLLFGVGASALVLANGQDWLQLFSESGDAAACAMNSALCSSVGSEAKNKMAVVMGHSLIHAEHLDRTVRFNRCSSGDDCLNGRTLREALVMINEQFAGLRQLAGVNGMQDMASVLSKAASAMCR